MRLSRRFRHSYFPRHFALCLPKTPSTDHQRTKPCSVPSCLRSNLERRCSFHKKGISHSKRAHGSFCIPTRAFAGQSSIRQLCASKGDAGRRLSESRSPDERRKLDRSADGRIFFERQMRTASFVVFEIILQNPAQPGLMEDPGIRDGWSPPVVPQRDFATVIGAQPGLPEYPSISPSHRTSHRTRGRGRAASNAGRCPRGKLPKVDGLSILLWG